MTDAILLSAVVAAVVVIMLVIGSASAYQLVQNRNKLSKYDVDLSRAYSFRKTVSTSTGEPSSPSQVTRTNDTFSSLNTQNVEDMSSCVRQFAASSTTQSSSYCTSNGSEYKGDYKVEASESSDDSESSGVREKSFLPYSISKKRPRSVPVILKHSSFSAVDKSEEKKQRFYAEGDIVGGRYLIGNCIGEGTFGQVTAALDLILGQRVALKILTNPKRHSTGRDEVRILRKLRALDPRGSCHWVEMAASFNYEGHFFIAFELLGPSLYEYQKKHNYAPYNVSDIRRIAYQVCHSVAFLHENKIAHTDLKPENIVFVSSCEDELTDVRIKLIDFGSAYCEEEEFTGTISTRHYRAPEVILKLGWSYPSDVWSIGCVLYEAYTGHVTFPKTHKNICHLAMMESVLGPLPASMQNSMNKTNYFEQGRLKSTEEVLKAKSTCRPLWNACRSGEKEDEELFKLINKMLTYEPSHRITCRAAMKEPFFAILPSMYKID